MILAASAPRLVSAQFTPQTTVGETTTDITPTPSSSPWGWLKMPKITMPKIEMPKMPADPLAPVKTSARKVKEGSKKAWEGTKELFTFGGNKTAEQPPERLASRPDQPSVWQRMFGGGEPEPEGPQTVADWMAQPRPESQ
jgi:hypothetical protein